MALRIDNAKYATCKNCGLQIKSFNGGASWVHLTMESRCPSPGFAQPDTTRHSGVES